MGVRAILQGGEGQHVAYHFQIADNTLQINVRIMLYLFCTRVELILFGDN